jgi:hypothetical protein
MEEWGGGGGLRLRTARVARTTANMSESIRPLRAMKPKGI